MKIVIEPVAIYGLFDDCDNECFYVGQTRTPNERKEHHFNPFRGKMVDGKKLTFRIIKWVDYENANNEESLLIKQYKQKGQARLNVFESVNGDRSEVKNNSWDIYWIEGDIVFAGFSQAGRYFKCTGESISNAIKHKGGRLSYGITLEKREAERYSRENGKKGGRPRKSTQAL